jgi:gliding motility-associated-like protein
LKVAKVFLSLFSGLILSTLLHAQPLVVNAGNNTSICPGTSAIIGGSPTASGGTSPYTYSWSPNLNISSTTVANPTVFPTAPTWYFVTVHDAAGNVSYDSVGVDINPVYADNAGNNVSMCIGSSATLGGPNNSMAGGVTYAWSPSTGLSSTTSPNPVTTTTITITYSLTITSPVCGVKSYSVTVTVNPLPTVDACCETTINEGESVNLNGTGGVEYLWSPGATLYNPYIQNTSGDPVITTLYYLWVKDANGCLNWDTVTIHVLPSSELVYYNTFSPNNDGVNDFFYIGNAGKYPDCRLEVYTRTGQLVYAKTGYDNSWDGTNYGDKLPEATYYYIFNPGDGSETKYGNVTIIR